MEIFTYIILIIAALVMLCGLTAMVFFAGPTFILMLADLAEVIEAKKQEWRELIEAGKGEK